MLEELQPNPNFYGDSLEGEYMRVQPVASPHAVQQTPTNPAAQKAKAVAAFNAGKSSYDAPSQTPIPVDANNIAPEDMSALAQPAQEEAASLAPTEETPAAAPAKEEPKDPALSRQFAHLAKQERQLRAKAQQQQQEFKVQQDAFQAEKAAYEAKIKDYESGYISRQQLKDNTLGSLAEANVSYDELTQQMLNHQPIDARTEALVKRLEAKIQGLEDKANLNVKAQEEQQQQAYRAAVKQIEMDVRQTVSNDPNFETIKATRSISDVVELIEETYKKDGILLSVEDACNEVENYLMDEAMKVTRIGKIKRRLEEAGQPKPNPQQTQAPKQQTQGMKTLTNAAASTRKLSARERALLAFKGELK